MKNKSLKIKLSSIEEQITNLSERLDRPQISSSDQKELERKIKKLQKDRSKTHRKLLSNELS
tara:strand:- start:31 stop:216 length:186 start_codon:yes stop_codon:yes gene_type:complete